MPPHHRHHRHHHHPPGRRGTIISLPNSFCSGIYRIWTALCCLGTRIEDSTTQIFPENNSIDPKVIKDTPDNVRDNSSDSDDELIREAQNHSGLITQTFLPMRVGLMILGRWPFLLVLQSFTTRNTNVRKIRVLNYDHSLKSIAWLYFALTTLFIFFVLVMSTVGFFDFFLHWDLLPNCRWATLQKHTFRKNLVMFLLVWGCMVHSTLSNISMFILRKRVTKTLNFWNAAAEELQIGNLSAHRRFIISANLGYVGFLVLIYCAYNWWNIRFVRDGATLFGTLAIMPLLNEHQLESVDEWKLQVFGILMIMYCVYASRAFLFMFCFECRILRTLFQVHNERLLAFLRRPENGDLGSEKIESRRLLRDTGILLKMVRQTDAVFGIILLSYYAIQLLNMCFEFYMLAKSGTDEFTRGDDSHRTMDILSAVITLLQNVYTFFFVSLDAASVGEVANEGYEALRRHPLSPHANQHKKYLTYNLGFIYNERIVLTAYKYFAIDRPFIITMLGSVLMYFVTILHLETSFIGGK